MHTFTTHDERIIYVRIGGCEEAHEDGSDSTWERLQSSHVKRIVEADLGLDEHPAVEGRDSNENAYRDTRNR
jgi:hypothetical protein